MSCKGECNPQGLEKRYQERCLSGLKSQEKVLDIFVVDGSCSIGARESGSCGCLVLSGVGRYFEYLPFALICLTFHLEAIYSKDIL